MQKNNSADSHLSQAAFVVAGAVECILSGIVAASLVALVRTDSVSYPGQVAFLGACVVVSLCLALVNAIILMRLHALKTVRTLRSVQIRESSVIQQADDVLRDATADAARNKVLVGIQ